MKLTGKVIKGIGGFYYVVAANALYECRARGLFRKQGITPLVGDVVDIEPTGEENVAFLCDVHSRTSELVRPAVANADQSMLIFAAARPDINFGLIDRFLANMTQQDMDTILCVTKTDLVDEDKLQSIIEIYDKAGYEIYPVCNKTGEGLDRILQVLKGKSTVLSGPSGVGKSSLIKNLIPHSEVEIGELSEKIGRGKNTTRHTELIELDNESTVYDTPGYSSIDLICNDETLLGDLFREFVPYIGECRFTGCSHISEPDCAVKNAVNDGIISSARYNSYKEMYSSIKARRKW